MINANFGCCKSSFIYEKKLLFQDILSLSLMPLCYGRTNTTANNTIGGTMKKFLKNQQGQGIMEYIILSSLIGIFCLVTMKQFGGVLRERIEHMKQEIVENIELK